MSNIQASNVNWVFSGLNSGQYVSRVEDVDIKVKRWRQNESFII